MIPAPQGARLTRNMATSPRSGLDRVACYPIVWRGETPPRVGTSGHCPVDAKWSLVVDYAGRIRMS